MSWKPYGGIDSVELRDVSRLIKPKRGSDEWLEELAAAVLRSGRIDAEEWE